MYGLSDFHTNRRCSCSPDTWPLLRRAPNGRRGSPGRVFAMNIDELRGGIAPKSHASRRGVLYSQRDMPWRLTRGLTSFR